VTALAPPASIVTALLATLVPKAPAAKGETVGSRALRAKLEDTTPASDPTARFPQLFKDLSDMEAEAAPQASRPSQLARSRPAAGQNKKNPPDDKADAAATPPAPATEKPWNAVLPRLLALSAATASRAAQPAAAFSRESAPLPDEAPRNEADAVASVAAREPDLQPQPGPRVASQPASGSETPDPTADPAPASHAQLNRKSLPGRNPVEAAPQISTPRPSAEPVTRAAATQPSASAVRPEKRRKRPDEEALPTSLPSPAATREAAQPSAVGPSQAPSTVSPAPPIAALRAPSDTARSQVAPSGGPSLREEGSASRAPMVARPLEPDPQTAPEPGPTTTSTDSSSADAPDARGELAFTVDIQPVSVPQLPAAPEAVTAASVSVTPRRAAETPLPAKPGSAGSSQPADNTPAVPAVDPSGQASKAAERHGRNPDSDAPSAAREKPRTAAAEAVREMTPASPSTADRPTAPAASPLRPSTEAASEAPAGRSAETAKEAAKESVPVPDSTPSAPAAQPAAVREIRLAVDSGDHRVDVHVTERSGDLHVDVRTPDARLASELREGLTALTARLEQSGFRAEAWHPPAAVQSHSPLAEVRAAAAPDSGGQEGRSGGRGGQNDQPRPKTKDSRDAKSKEDRQGFASLMENLT